MARRVIHDADYMSYVMTPPSQEDYAKYNNANVDVVRVISKDRGVDSGLGQLPTISSGSGQSEWVMPVVIIVVSAMALMTLYAVLNKK